jgi:hypothetical protein
MRVIGSGRSNARLGAKNFSTVVGISRPGFGVGHSPKPTVLERRGAGALKVFHNRGPYGSGRLNKFTGGDIWPNKDEECRRIEYKAFTNPKMFGGA